MNNNPSTKVRRRHVNNALGHKQVGPRHPGKPNVNKLVNNGWRTRAREEGVPHPLSLTMEKRHGKHHPKLGLFIQLQYGLVR